jgi:hypothetical protein
MNPTNYLRFIKRFVPIHGEPHSPNGSVGRSAMILQQLWESPTKVDLITGEFLSEWRDVPTEEA